MILMWSCPGNMPKYYPGLRDVLPSPSGQVICLSDLGNILAYYLDKTTLLYKYQITASDTDNYRPGRCQIHYYISDKNNTSLKACYT